MLKLFLGRVHGCHGICVGGPQNAHHFNFRVLVQLRGLAIMAATGGNIAPNGDEIQSLTLYNIRPLLFHGYIFPFVFLYSGWLYGWIIYGVADYWEPGLIVLASIGLLQILTSLFCLWFVQVRCLLTAGKVNGHTPFVVHKIVVDAFENGRS